jgi:hypothetical protein
MRTAPDDTLHRLKDRKAVIELLHYYCHAARELKEDAAASPRRYPHAEARASAAGGSRRR